MIQVYDGNLGAVGEKYLPPNYFPGPGSPVSSSLPSWVIPSAVGVGLLGLGYFLLRKKRK